jgi:hypothetical protein
MTQPPPGPPSLDYRIPRSRPPSPTRQKAFRHALGNGVACVVLGLLLGAMDAQDIASFSRNHIVFNAIWTIAILNLNAMAFLFGGIIYIIASVRIRQPNVLWERTLCVTCAIHIGIVILMYVAIFTIDAIFTFDARNRYLEGSVVIAYILNFPAIVVLMHMLLLALYTRWRCE